ncbi:MAG: hypothetical protein FWG94_01555 [Oscillospiraceae bacterium]|nr:hypothetical protein [Oscillospiraceae bacterium]
MIVKIKSILMAVLTAAIIAFPAFAAENINDNPATGDTSGQYLWIGLIVLGVSFAVIIALIVTGGKKKK